MKLDAILCLLYILTVLYFLLFISVRSNQYVCIHFGFCECSTFFLCDLVLGVEAVRLGAFISTENYESSKR